MSDVEFVDGLMIKPPREGAPDFVKGSISIKRADLGNWLRGKQDEWINLDIKEAKNGKWYAQVNTWKPNKDVDGYPKSSQQANPTYGKSTPAQASQSFQDDDSDKLPF